MQSSARRIVGAAMALGAVAALASALPVRAQAGGPPQGCTGPASPTWLLVTIEGVRNSSGQLMLTLYPDDRKRFLARGGSLYVTHVEARAGITQACIFVPTAGIYALALYHDENANTAFDRSGLGLPKEGWGFSNNPATLLGPPSFSSARLGVPGTGLHTRIRMKYP